MELNWPPGKPWISKSLVWGFQGKPADFSRDRLQTSARELLSSCFPPQETPELILMDQHHTNKIVMLLEPQDVADSLYPPTSTGLIFTRSPADGIIAAVSALKGRLLGVRTADCLPIVIFAWPYIAAVHAGWRGLANQILAAVVEALLNLPDAPQLDRICTLIGPHADEKLYQVGPEVVESIGAAVVSANQEQGQDKFLLSLGQTAKNQLLRQGLLGSNIHIHPERTISDSRWHSHRADHHKPEGRGSNLGHIGVRENKPRKPGGEF